MTKRLPLLALGAILLAGCTSKDSNVTTIQDENMNPLTAERYGEELADTLANLIIQNDPIVEDSGTKEMVQREITKAKAIARVGKEDRSRGSYGALIGTNQEMNGNALYVDNRLYISSDFYTDPGPSLHLYFTTIVDPRDGTFPDGNALDLGEIQSIYGPQTYMIDSDDANADLYRTVVLFDTSLKRIYGFAQLSGSR